MAEGHKLDGVPEALQFGPRSEFWHFDTLAVIDRDAFVANLFTGYGPVSVAARNAGLDRTHWRPVTPEQLSAWALLTSRDLAAPSGTEREYRPSCYDWPRVYDFVLWIDFGHAPVQLPRFLERWAEGSYFHIYRVMRP